MDLTHLLESGVKQNASDIHISPGVSPIFRIHGELICQNDIPPLDPPTTQRYIFELLDKKQQIELETKFEIDFSFKLPNIANFRINAFKQHRGLAAVLRIIPNKISTIEELGLPSVIKDLLDLPNGLILVTGPTGSGKSTTLAAMIDYINTFQSQHIITIEDPIEFTHPNKKSLINQRQLVRDTHDFAGALRSALREDPDIIMVGEMRDLETIRLALSAAETGHLVMGTLHTSSAPRTITRIIDVFPTGEKNIIRNMLSESLQAVICQTLLKKTTEGRVAAFEIMLGTTAIRNLIREDKISQMISSMQMGNQIGMCTFEQYLKKLVDNKIILPFATFPLKN